jgi:menaquinone-dependent protoporphyrinogen oxidase
MAVLVAYGSKRGGTRGIAEIIGEVLTERGVTTDIRDVREVDPAAGYDAVIVGGALYAMRWHRAARRYVKRNERSLREIPVWLFSSGPLDGSATEREIPPVRQVQVLMDRVRARGHVTFGGRLEHDAKGFPASAMAKKHAGDWRDQEKIRRWANDVADELTQVRASLP